MAKRSAAIDVRPKMDTIAKNGPTTPASKTAMWNNELPNNGGGRSIKAQAEQLTATQNVAPSKPRMVNWKRDMGMSAWCCENVL